MELPEAALGLLMERTEGWAAGLRLAALSLAGHPDPERFAAEFSGSERTVAEYLLAEVLDRQSRTGTAAAAADRVLERVNGELADLLTGGAGGERVLQDLEEANAFVVPLDAARSWFRYHRLFADLLQLELRRTAPARSRRAAPAAAGWLADHGYPVEAVRHAQAARGLGHWPPGCCPTTGSACTWTGRRATAHELLAGFPAGASAADAELAAVAAADAAGRRGPWRRRNGTCALAERRFGVRCRPPGARQAAGACSGPSRLLLALRSPVTCSHGDRSRHGGCRS